MIELVQAPDMHRIIADGNDTLIKIRTTTAGDQYIRATIFIDGVEFLKQGWSKDDEGLCVFNLKHLYYAYFQNQFSAEISTGFHTMSGLFKRVKIKVEEFMVGGIYPVDSLTLPEFHIIKNHKPQVFDDTRTVQFLNLPQDSINVSRDAGFRFPLFLTAGELLTVSILNDLGQVIHSETLENYETQVSTYELIFEDLPIDDLDTIFVRFATSQDQVQKKLKFINETIFPAKQIFYLNNCGFYIPAYLLGRKESNSSLSPKSYAQYDGTEVTYDVEDVKELKLNSGYGYKHITALIHAIATSIDVRVNLEGFWERVKSETKKVQDFVDNQFIYFEVLQFSRLNVANFTNDNTYALLPEVVNIEKTGDENEQIQISKADFLAAYTSIQPATRLRINELPENGKISYQTALGTFNISDMVANDPSKLPFEIVLEELISVLYKPNFTEFGAPLDEINFQIGPEVLWSNVGKLIMNVEDIVFTSLPPSIDVNSIVEIGLDESGSGSKRVYAAITDPENDAVEIEWEVLNGAPITFDDNTIPSPTIAITGGIAPETYQIKINVLDSTGAFATEIINVKTSSYVVSASAFSYSPQDNYRLADLRFEGGQFQSKFRVRFTLSAFYSNQYVILHSGEANEHILYGSGASKVEELTFNFSMETVFRSMRVKVVNGTPGSTVTLLARIEDVDAPQFIDETKREISVSL